MNLTGIVPGDPPSTPAEILEPEDGAHVTVSEIVVKGSCEANALGRMIEIYRDSAFVGSTQCTPAGQFEITITVLPGPNELIAKTVDWVGQYGPDSDPVTVIYDVPVSDQVPGSGSGPSVGTPGTGQPLQLIVTERIVKATGRNKDSTFKYQIAGGKAPYAVTVDWGDGSRDDVASLAGAGSYSFKHTYRKAGLYQVTFRAVDSLGNQAIFQILVVVDETAVPPYEAGTLTTPQACAGMPNSVECYLTSRVANLVDKLWPAFVVATLMTLSFWLGEKLMYLQYFNRKLRGRKVA